jgi:predicted transcriptional regulator
MERVNITLEPEDLALLDVLTARTGLSRSAVIRQAIHRFASAARKQPARARDFEEWLRQAEAQAAKAPLGDAVAEIRYWRDRR